MSYIWKLKAKCKPNTNLFPELWKKQASFCYLVTFYVLPWPAAVHLNFQAGSPFPVPVCTVPNSMDRTSRCNKVDAVRLYASYRLNLLLLKGPRCLGCRDLGIRNLTLLQKLNFFLTRLVQSFWRLLDRFRIQSSCKSNIYIF